MPLNIYASEIADASDQLAGWGIKIVMDGFESGGHKVTFIHRDKWASRHDDFPDVWLVSIPYAGNAWMIRDFFESIGLPMDKKKRTGGPLFLLGGHAVVGTHQYLDIFDAVFVGEADDQLEAMAKAVPSIEALSDVPGIDTGKHSEVWFQQATSLRARGLHKAQGKAENVGETHYLEVARGCKSKCKFCEIGWAYGYTERSEEDTRKALQDAEKAGIKKRLVVLSAPDTDGVSYFADWVQSGEYDPRWRSTRIRPYLRSEHGGVSGKRGKIRFGVEGVSERLRRLTGKYMSNEELEQAVTRAFDEGYRNARVFLIAGLPTETIMDRMEIEAILDIYRRSEARHWKACEIKITGLSPQPFTPWQRFGIASSVEAVAEYRSWRAQHKTDKHWRSVMVDRGNTEADLFKRMKAGELIRYLELRPRGSQAESGLHRWRQIQEWANKAGIDYAGRVLDDMPLDADLPWQHVRHPFEARLRAAETAAWKQLEAAS